VGVGESGDPVGRGREQHPVALAGRDAGGPPLSARHSDESHSLNQPVGSVQLEVSTSWSTCAFRGCNRWATLRTHLIAVPARIASSARRLVLHLPTDWPWAAAWETSGPPQPPLDTRPESAPRKHPDVEEPDRPADRPRPKPTNEE
jgi:hypothetical protein